MLHLRGLLLQLAQLLFQFFGVGRLAGFAHLLGLFLQIGLGGLVTLGQLVEFILHLLELFCQVGLLLLGQVAVFQLILEFFQIFGGLFQIAFAYILGEFVGRPAVNVLQLVQLLLDFIGPAQLLAAVLQLPGKIVEFAQGLFPVRRRGSQFLGALFQFFEKVFRFLQAFLFGFLAALGNLFVHRFRGLFYLRFGVRILRLGSGGIVKQRWIDKQHHDKRRKGRGQRQEKFRRRDYREFLGNVDAFYASEGIGA